MILKHSSVENRWEHRAPWMSCIFCVDFCTRMYEDSLIHVAVLCLYFVRTCSRVEVWLWLSPGSLGSFFILFVLLLITPVTVVVRVHKSSFPARSIFVTSRHYLWFRSWRSWAIIDCKHWLRGRLACITKYIVYDLPVESRCPLLSRRGKDYHFFDYFNTRFMQGPPVTAPSAKWRLWESIADNEHSDNYY